MVQGYILHLAGRSKNYKVLNRMDIVLMYIRVVRPLNAAQSSHRSSLEEVYHICGTLETYSQHRHLLLEDLSMVSTWNLPIVWKNLIANLVLDRRSQGMGAQPRAIGWWLHPICTLLKLATAH